MRSDMQFFMFRILQSPYSLHEVVRIKLEFRIPVYYRNAIIPSQLSNFATFSLVKEIFLKNIG